MNKVKFSIPAAGAAGVRLEVDGVDVAPAVREISIDARAGQFTDVTIKLAAVGTEVEGEARLWLAAAQVGLLARFGWRPPDGHVMNDRGDVMLTEAVGAIRSEPS